MKLLTDKKNLNFDKEEMKLRMIGWVRYELNPFWYMRRFWHRAKTVWSFAKMGWGDNDWDHTYLLQLMEFKLKRMSKFFHNDEQTHIEANQQVANEIDHVLEQLKLHNTYEEILVDNHKSHLDKWGKCEHNWIPVEGTTHFEFVTKYTKAKNNEENEIAKKSHYAIIEEEEKIKVHALEHAFNFMGRKLERWWD